MRRLSFAALLLAGPAWAQSAKPAPKPAPVAGWPCEVEPAPTLLPATYWAEAATKGARGWQSEPVVVALVEDVAPRSVAEPDAVKRLRAFSGPSPARARIAAGLVDTIDAERRQIIAGILRYNARQDVIARRIEGHYAALDKLPKDDAAARAPLEEAVQWDERIFEDRQRMLPIICRQPAALEARLTALVGALKTLPPR